MSKKSADDKVPLTQADFDRFHKNAPAALRRRGWHYLREEVLGGAQTIVFGSLPIVGLMWWSWSAMGMLVFLLVTCWIGIFCDATKFFALKKRAIAFADIRYNDWHVWVVVEAIRNGSREAYPEHINAKWQPSAGVFIDFAMGGVSTLLIVIMLSAEGWLSAATFQKPGFLLSLGALLVLRVLGTAAEILHHKSSSADRLEREDEDRPVKVAVGLRGAGLFLMVFLTAMLTENDDLPIHAPKVSMLIIHGLIVTMGLLNLFGPLMLRGEIQWLRNYLAEREQNPDAQTVES